ncbi:MAG: MFS transporter [Planctomycetota bacterium]|nr:MFS transporter [Planctomycetota bacterium]
MNQNATTNALSGTARLSVVIPAVIVGFFYLAALEYMLPLYFSALADAARAAGDPTEAGVYASIYSTLMKYQVTPWIVGPIMAGMLSRRYGERRVWAYAQLAMVIIPVMLVYLPTPLVIKTMALWSGITGALIWIGGVSLVQMVAPERKGLSNGLMMASLGVGSLVGPICARGLLYREELGGLLHEGDVPGFLAGLFSFTQLTRMLEVSDFRPIFLLLTVMTALAAVLIGGWGQRPGRFQHEEDADWSRTVLDLGRLIRLPKFWALVLPLCFLGGAVFQATNMYLPYRAEDLGLKSGAQDFGWIWLTVLKTFVWIVGGLAVGLLAGRRAPGIAAVIMLGGFSLMSLGIGLSAAAWQLFVFVVIFEFIRQFMRWSHAGYLSEHMPAELRATAIGCSITISGLGSTIYAWVADYMILPESQSPMAFYMAACLGLIGCTGLFIFDRIRPIREAEPEDLGECSTISMTGEAKS